MIECKNASVVFSPEKKIYLRNPCKGFDLDIPLDADRRNFRFICQLVPSREKMQWSEYFEFEEKEFKFGAISVSEADRTFMIIIIVEDQTFDEIFTYLFSGGFRTIGLEIVTYQPAKIFREKVAYRIATPPTLTINVGCGH